MTDSTLSRFAAADAIVAPMSNRERLVNVLVEIEQLEDELRVERAKLGESAADGNVGSECLEKLGTRHAELEALREAVSILERRIAAEDAAEARRRAVEEHARKVEQHERQVEAAESVDSALAQLGQAWTAFIAAGNPLPAASGHYLLRACLYRLAPGFGADAGVARPHSERHKESLATIVSRLGPASFSPESHNE